MLFSGDVESQRERQRTLTLDFECIRSVAEGTSEVRVWRDKNLSCDRVGKRIDKSQFSDSVPEPEILQAISHRNVVEIISAAKVSGFTPPMDVIEIITPYYPRGSITDALLAGQHFQATEAVQVLLAALQGLRELHEVHRIIHRDIKSGNILLCEGYPFAKVADLGLAGRMDGTGRVPSLENPTLYSPPEFVETGVLGQDSDIYAMGLVLRELLGGPFPYIDYQRSDVIEKLLRLENPISVADRLLPIWAPKDLRKVYRKATERNRAARYQTARQMAADLSRAKVADWQEVEETRWEAACLKGPGMVCVEARWKPRTGRYTMTTKRRRKLQWYTAADDAVVVDLRSADARKVFDHATKIACAT